MNWGHGEFNNWAERLSAEDEAAGHRLIGLIALVGLFVVSGFFAANELRYDLFGRTVEARVTRVAEFRVGRRWGRGKRLAVRFVVPGDAAVHADTLRIGRTDTAGRVPADGGPILAEEIRGAAGTWRVKTRRNALAVYAFWPSAALLAVATAWLVRYASREANRPFSTDGERDVPIPPLSPKRRRRRLPPDGRDRRRKA